MMRKFRKARLFFMSAVSTGVFSLVFLSLGQGDTRGAVPSQKEILQTRINDLRKQIDIYQKEIDDKSAKEESLSNSIEVLEADIKKIEIQIEETNLQIASLAEEISEKEIEIEKVQKKVDAKKEMLSRFLRELYEREEEEIEEIIFTGQSFSDYFFKIESLENFENRIREAHDQLEISKENLKDEKRELIEKKIEKENLRGIQSDQERSLEQEKQMKTLLVSQIRNEKLALEQNLARLRQELDEIQSLGKPINLEEAIEAAKYAADLTQVAPEFLLGVLRVESGLGTNVGGGRYKTDMNPSQWDTFKSLCKELKLDPEKTPVSRRACYNPDSEDGCGGWGGAMGPAQFLPSTWMGYKNRVESLTGKKPADPWNLKDSLVAMGLKLGSVERVQAGDRKAWAKAAGMYLAGSNWEKYSWYSDRVLYYADGFKKILKKH